MIKFDPELSAPEYARMTDEQQRQWDRDLLDYWGRNYKQQTVDDFYADAKVITEEEWGGQK